MNERGIEVKVGILITVCVGLLVAFVMLLGDFKVAGGAELFLDVPTSADLKPGAPVKIAGVPAGKVKEVAYLGGELDPKTGRRVSVRVRLEIDEKKLVTIREDALFYITTQGVLGEKYVEIDPGDPLKKAYQPGDVAEGLPPLRLEIMAMNANHLLATLTKLIRENEAHLNEIIVDASATVKSVKRAVERVEGLVAANEPKVGQVLDELLAIEAKANTLLAAANVALGDGTTLAKTVGNAEALTRDVRGYLPGVVGDARKTLDKYAALADTGKVAVDDAKVQITGLLGSAEKVMGDAKGLTERIASGKGTIGALLADKEMYDDIREMMKDMKRHPWKFLWKE